MAAEITIQKSKIPSSFLLTVQDATEYTETAEENSHNEEDEEDEEEEEEEEVPASVPCISSIVPHADVVRSVEDLKAHPVPREVRTPPPPRVPAKLLPRLGSLDSQYHVSIHLESLLELQIKSSSQKPAPTPCLRGSGCLSRDEPVIKIRH